MLTLVRTYAAHIANQEDPREMPSEVALHLSALLGCPHYTAHRALVNVNPELWQDVSGGVFLAHEDAGPVADEVHRLLLADARAYRRAWRLVKATQSEAFTSLTDGSSVEGPEI